MTIVLAKREDQGSASLGATTGVHEKSLETARFQDLCKDTNINSNTLLATDYLNHFNEIIMLLEMVPSMPDIFEDIAAWQPKSYVQHFEASGLFDKMLAIEAYAHVPSPILAEFNATVTQLNDAVASVIDAIKGIIEADMLNILAEICKEQSLELMLFIDRLSAIINGTISLDDAASAGLEHDAGDSVGQTQATVEALFE